MNYDTLCLSGGGIMGLSFIGVLKYLENKKYINLNNVNIFVGTSAGSIISFFLILGYNIKEIKKIISNLNFQKLEPNIDMIKILENNGIDNGLKIMTIIISFLQEKFKIDDITFEELYNKTNKKLIIIGTNFTLLKEEVFSYELTPNMSVILAIRISISIPFIFTPILYNSNYYIDGGFTNCFPIKYCNKNSTLGIYITFENNIKEINIINLLLGCLSIINNTITLKDIDNYNVINIKSKNLDITDYNIDYKTKLEIINFGKNCAEKYLTNLINNICKNIIYEIINNILL